MGKRARQTRPAVAVIARLGRQIAMRGRTRFGDTAASLLLAGDGLVYKLTKAVSLPHPAEGAGAPWVKLSRWTVREGGMAGGSKKKISDGPRA